MKLWLVRHGETEANVAGLYSGHAPTPLTPRGVAQARALGERLRLAPFDKVFCSELARTGTTADLLLGGTPGGIVFRIFSLEVAMMTHLPVAEKHLIERGMALTRNSAVAIYVQEPDN